jgi:WD40 repeat protein
MSTAPYSLLDITILQDGRFAISGGVTSAPDGQVFALKYTNPQKQKYTDPCMIELRSWEDLSLVKTITIPQAFGPFWSIASSPDGRWLVVATGNPERLFLFDRHTGKVMSHHALWGCVTSGLTFDPTSTFVAGYNGHGNWGHLMLWRLTAAESWFPRMEERPHDQAQKPDEILGSHALNLEHWELDRTGIAWPKYDLADTIGTTVFSPDSHLVVFRLISSYNTPCIDFVAYEVPSGKQRWCIQRESTDGSGEYFTFTPDGQHVLICGQDNNLSMYRASDGMLQYYFPSGLHEPIRALAFDHDSTTLWLASGETLVAYELQGGAI